MYVSFPKPHTLWVVVAISLLLVGLTSAGSEAFEIRRSTIDAGGGRSTGGDFVVTGSIGQPDVGHASGADFSVGAGRWGSETPSGPDPDLIFADGFEPTGGTP